MYYQVLLLCCLKLLVRLTSPTSKCLIEKILHLRLDIWYLQNLQCTYLYWQNLAVIIQGANWCQGQWFNLHFRSAKFRALHCFWATEHVKNQKICSRKFILSILDRLVVFNANLNKVLPVWLLVYFTPCWSPLVFWNFHFSIHFKLG